MSNAVWVSPLFLSTPAHTRCRSLQRWQTFWKRKPKLHHFRFQLCHHIQLKAHLPANSARLVHRRSQKFYLPSKGDNMAERVYSEGGGRKKSATSLVLGHFGSFSNLSILDVLNWHPNNKNVAFPLCVRSGVDRKWSFCIEPSKLG